MKLNKLKKIIKESLEEVAMSGFDINKNYIGLIQEVSGISGQIKLSLFNFKERICIGKMTLMGITDRAYTVTTAAAEQGMGPKLYEFGMMAVYPSGICPDRIGETSRLSFPVWKKFVDSRPDITKKAINPNEEEYTFKYAYDEEKTIILNYIFYRTPDIWYKKLLSNGERLMKEYNISREEISKACSDYFMHRYKER